ncbi:MAG: PD40 domain-containing protein [Gemmatimonadetes bacterium]|nr:PD40 domain-containing protein [Gemmatimonadota bacterium]
MTPVRCAKAPGVALLALLAGVSHLAAQGVSQAAEPAEKFFGAITQVTFGGQNAEAYFSADGKRLILQRQENDSTCDQEYTINADGSDLRRVSNGLGRTTCGYFYANDQRILYSSTFKAGSRCPVPPDMSRGYTWGLFDYDIYTAKPDGSDLKQLTTTPRYDAESVLSPDGKRIVFTSLRDGDLDLYTMNVDGTGVRRVTDRMGYDGGAVWSPDGKLIAWRAWYPQTDQEKTDYQELLKQNLVRPTRMELWVANVDGSNARQVTNLGGANFAPAFTPEGKRLIFASNYTNPRSRNFDLYLVNLDGSGLSQVTTYNDFDAFPMFSPDGKKLVFASNRYGKVAGETNIFIAEWKEAKH